MKKRITCVLLTLIMLMSLLPISASAAGMAVSERAITVLKQMQYYSEKCTATSGGEYRSGYGTICNVTAGEHGVHTTNEQTADKALRAKLADLSAAVNSFASSSGVSLTQGQFDALVVFSYDCGTSWMTGSGVFKSAVVNGLTGHAFLNAIGHESGYGSDANWKGSVTERRMIEANMYLNGAYSNIAPGNYCYVTYDANGGVMAEGTDGKYTQYFDGNNPNIPAPVPTKAGHIFLGWYENNISWVSKLGVLHAGKHLVAKWQPVGASYSEALEVYDWLAVNMLASTVIVNNPVSKTAIGVQTAYNVYLDRDFIDAKGVRWGRLDGNKGWVIVNGNADVKSFDIDVTVTVTNSTLNSRVNASISSAQNGTYKKGDQLRIISTANGSGFLWGQVADENGVAIGWVALMYTNWNSVKDAPVNNTTETTAIANAVINCQGYLNVRSEAGTDNSIVGALADGDHVEIYEIKFVNGHKWGRTTQGWILLTYAKVTMVDGKKDNVNTDDVLAYTFTGTLKSATTAHTDVTHNSDTIGKELKAGTTVAVSMVKNDEHGDIWGFNGTGWIKLDNVNMDVAKYVVITDSVTVRKEANSGSKAVEKVVKGVELDITEIKVVDATIWGKTEKYGGWVNLASKYVQRSNAPIIENVQSTAKTGLLGTVINTGSVNVRNTGSTTYGKIIGSLSGGTTVIVWEQNGKWYKVDSNQNGEYDYETDGWVSSSYLSVYTGTLEEESDDTTTGSNGTTTGTGSAVVETGLGVVANTYTGVNVRQGAGTGYAAVGKILTGTTVEILEVTSTATSKWGRTAQGWVCMDYITMVSKYPIGGAVVEDTNSNAGQNVGGSTSNTEGNTTVSSTPAIYTGTAINTVPVMKTTDIDSTPIRTINAGENITIQELVKVTTKATITAGNTVDGNSVTETITTTTSVTYWGRVNDGWILDPAINLQLHPLDETTYTVVNYEEVNVRDAANGSTIITTLDKGTQVAVTNLQIVDDKVWGYVEDLGTSGGWIRLDNMSQGAISVNTAPQTPPPAVTEPSVNLGIGSSTGGFVTNTSGYRYTGKVINTNSVNVRALPTTGSAVTTTLKYGASLVIYETTIAENMAWGRCDAGWIYLYYVDLTPVTGALDARVVYQENTVCYDNMNGTPNGNTFARMSVIDIYEYVGNWARTEKGWVQTTNLL